MDNNLETPLPRIVVAAPTLNGNEKRYVLECLETTWISSIGRFITEFESAFARFCGVEHAVAVNNGTNALHLALVALGLKPGDEVIVPTLTYIATANAVTYCGAKPVLVDCNPRDTQHGSGRYCWEDHSAYEGHHPGASLRPSNGHGPDRFAGA